MTREKVNNYKFAIGRKIQRIFTESELYLDGKYCEYNPFENLSIRRIDKPIFMLLDNDILVKLYATSFSIADDYDKKYVFGEDFTSNKESQKEFERLCGLTIIDVQELYENKYDYADEQGNFPKYLDEFKNSDEKTDLIILFNNGLRVLCYMFLDYFDIEFVENTEDN